MFDATAIMLQAMIQNKFSLELILLKPKWGGFHHGCQGD